MKDGVPVGKKVFSNFRNKSLMGKTDFENLSFAQRTIESRLNIGFKGSADGS